MIFGVDNPTWMERNFSASLNQNLKKISSYQIDGA